MSSGKAQVLSFLIMLSVMVLKKPLLHVYIADTVPVTALIQKTLAFDATQVRNVAAAEGQAYLL